jgi:hypothetical protein
MLIGQNEPGEILKTGDSGEQAGINWESEILNIPNHFAGFVRVT